MKQNYNNILHNDIIIVCSKYFIADNIISFVTQTLVVYKSQCDTVEEHLYIGLVGTSLHWTSGNLSTLD